VSPATIVYLNAEAVAGHAHAAGFRGESLAIAVAVAKAESGFNPGAVGDVDLTVRGERSVGLWQVNYRPARDAAGGARDPNLNLDPSFNARTAYTISSGGSKWSPWSAYTSGAYRKHLDEARTAARTVEARGGTANAPATGTRTASSSTVPGPTTADILKRVPPPSLASTPGVIEVGPEPAMFGKALADIVGDRLLDQTLDLGIDAVPELTFTIAIPPGKVNAVLEHFTDGAQVDYGELRFLIAAVELGPADAGLQLTVTARSFGMQRLRKDTLAGPWSNMSPTEVLATLAARNAMGFVGKGSPTRPTIARADGANEGEEESALDLAERLAKELGYVLFDGGQVLYFGPPTWILDQGTEVRADYGMRLGFDIVSQPTIRRTVDDEDRRRTINVELPYERGRLVRPGHRLDFDGIAAFRGSYLVASVGWNETDRTASVKVEAITPVDPVPEPGDEAFGASASGQATPASSVTGAGANLGRANPLDFVTVAMAQVGDAYVFGTEVRLDDPDPTAFDCSELVQWACSRVGVSIVDGSSAQIAACKAIPVAEAARIRGALLWHSGHIAISLGDGANTVEAMGRKYGVVQGRIASRFTKGGLIPGMNYTSGQVY
jgi:cell wall-associated NlpC family hydrolase